MHLTDELLDGLATNALSGGDRLRAERHLEECGACREDLVALRALLARARALPTAIAPPPELWGEITDAVAARRARGADHSASSPRPPRRWVLAAAAVLLVAVSSATTAWLLRGRDAASAPSGVAAAHPAGPRSALVAFSAVDGEYEAAARELGAALEARRGELSPETVASIERSLATIDLAIREARDALARDPGNHAIVSLLATRWAQKVDLLRRSTELSSRS